MSVIDTIRKVDERDEATARLLLRMALFEATCAEADRVRPQLEAEVRKAMGEKAAQGLRHLARQPRTEEVIKAADALVQVLEFSKTEAGEDDDPNTDYWDARGPKGQFRPGKARRGFFNVLGFASGAKDVNAGERTRTTMGAWTGPTSDNYSRLRSLGGGLVATDDPNARAAGTVARLIGDIGPEAQKALEPGIRRTAYRYRGTEKRPNATLAAQAPVLAAGAYELTPEQLRRERFDSPDQARLNILSDLGAAHLLRQIPDRETAAISLAAGKMPPSVGVMFDAQGRVVTEAQGFNGDHYLPFDLANLKRMKGGSYVRTRTTGGPTDEDIYAGLMTGARHMTVISNSGYFAIEFQPDMRGGRRYSDKARQMVDRYSRLVGAIGTEKLYQRELPPERIRTLRQEALTAAGNNAEEANRIFQRRKTEALAASAFASGDEDELRAQAAADVKADPTGYGTGTFEQKVKERFQTLLAEDQQNNARIYRLDGEGYRAAMRALKTEFPYYIRDVQFVPLQQYMDMKKLSSPDEPRRPSGGTDLGYTTRGGVDPEKVQYLGSKDPRGGEQGGSEGQKDGVKPGGPAAGSGGAGATAGGKKLAEVVKQGLIDKQRDVANAFAASLRARVDVGSPAWNKVQPNQAGQGPVTEEQVLSDAKLTPDVYIEFLADKYSNDWGLIAKHILESDKPEVLPVVEKALDFVDKTLDSVNGGRPANWGKDGFTAAKEYLEQVKMLKKPFKEGAADPYLVPGVSDRTPQDIPEVTSLALDNETLGKWALQPENEEAAKKAREWIKGGVGHEQIKNQIIPKAQHLKNLRDFATNGGVWNGAGSVTPEIARDAADLARDNDKHHLAKEVANLHKAWTLVRLQEIREATGLNKSGATGAADPFAKAAGAASLPSRLRFLDPSSPEAQVLSRALVAKRRSPSLRQVRLPASR